MEKAVFLCLLGCLASGMVAMMMLMISAVLKVPPFPLVMIGFGPMLVFGFAELALIVWDVIKS